MELIFNVAAVLFMMCLITGVYMVFCRNANHFSGITAASDATFFGGFFNRLYFVVSTFTTIGFGDVSPVSFRARAITIFLILSVFTLILKTLTSFIETYNKNIKKYIQTVANAPGAAAAAFRTAKAPTQAAPPRPEQDQEAYQTAGGYAAAI